MAVADRNGSGVRLHEFRGFARRIAEDEWHAEAEGKGLQESERIDYSAALGWFHDGQKGAWNSGTLETVVVAGTGGGKTAMQAPWLLREIQRCAPLIKKLGSGKFIYAGPTMTLLGEQAIPAFEDLFQDEEGLGRLVRGSKHKFHFSEEGKARVLGFTDCNVTVTFAYTNDSSNLESMVALAGVWDEAGQKENKQASYRAYNRRLKVARSITFGQIYEWLESQGLLQEFDWWVKAYYEPEGPDARFGRRLWGTTPYEWNWFKTDVYDRAEQKKPGFSFFSFPSWMNPNISEDECRQELENGMPLWDWEMMYAGVFRRPAGLIYSGFDSFNKVPAFTVPKEWRKFVGGDFGNENTAALILAEDPGNEDLYIIAEYKKAASAMKELNPFEEHVKNIKELAECTPTGAGGSHQEEGWREAYRKNGLPLEEPPVNDVEVQIGCVIALINTKKLKIFETCVGTIAQMESYSRELDDDFQPIDNTIKNKARYHYLDGLRYVITWRHPPALRPKPLNIPPHLRLVGVPRN